MSDRLPVRDRTLVLRILVPRLEARLRDKMKECEERAAAAASSNSNNNNNNTPAPAPATTPDSYLDLEGVTCQPTEARHRTLWEFCCDGARYPATLVNLPCPIELHKTHDHAMYYKSVDVAQMLIVYEDDMALEEAQEQPTDGYPSYYHSGVTPPMHRVVERRFATREHERIAPPRRNVAAVERELVQLMGQLHKDEKVKKVKIPKAGTSSSHTQARVLEEVTEEIVNYEPWMDDYGRQPQGVQFDADDQICSAHPEVWLKPEDILAIQNEAAEAKRKQLEEQQQLQRKKRQDAENIPAAKPKKGIASKKNRPEPVVNLQQQQEMVDDVTLAASMMAAGDGNDLLGVDEDFFKEFDLDDDDMNFDEMN
ncbi:hypothetical protein MPSEU_000334800 [Mayamaea pseudoterrestris]|nr:hypothetical protein MPSEU_000334800 [Mayamaea pseudoterrestris]